MNYDYLVTGEVSAIRENGATSGVGVLASYSYDNLGNRTAVTFGNGAAQSYGYDPVSRLASLTNDLSGTTNDLSVTFAYNPASQIAQTVRTGDAYAFTGHANASTAYAQNGLNQQVAIGGSAAGWDARGNLTSDPTSGKTYGYSSENLLTSASGGVTLGYDPSLRLYQVAGAATTRFAYDGADAIAEYDGSNALQRRFVFGPGVDAPIVWYEGTGTTDRRFMSSDERGSIISLTDSSGALLNLNRYDEYGKPQSTNVGRFQYTGQTWLSEIGAYHYKARVYLPHLGIFAQADPIGPVDSPNLYGYVGGDPVNSTDPLGLEGWCGGVWATVCGHRHHDAPNTGWTNRDNSTKSPGDRNAGPDDNNDAPIVITGKRPKPKPPSHRYGYLIPTVCSASDIFSRFLEPGNSAPGAPRARPGRTSNIRLWGNGGRNLITQVVDPRTFTITNITQRGHQFYPGTVTIQIIPQANNTSDIQIVGTGSGPEPLVNDAVGLAFFGTMARIEAELCLARSGYPVPTGI